MHNTNATADLSACNGTSATLGQHNAYPDRDDTERTRPVTTPFVLLSHDLRPLFAPLELAYASYDASLTYISDDVVLFWPTPSAFSQWTPSPFTVDLVEYNCAEQFMMASKARLFGNDTELSAILASDDPREQKRLGRQVLRFDHDLWQTECENIVRHGNLAKFPQNEEMRLALIRTGDRRLAEASPPDTLWGIVLSACDPRASSPDSWCSQNLLDRALDHGREILRRDTTAPLRNPAPVTPVPRDDTGDTVFEVDPITPLRFDTDPPSANTQTASLSAFTDLVPDDHAPEVLLAQEQRIAAPLIPEQGPDLISGVVTMDDATFTILLSLHRGVSATSRFNCRALLDTGSPQSFIHQGVFDQMVATGAADASCVRSTTPRTWSDFGPQQLLSTHRQARMTVQFNHDGTPFASLAVWMYIVPNENMRCPLLLCRDSWMRFHSHSYQTLSPQPDGRVFSELTLPLCDDNLGSAAAYIRNHEVSDAAYHLVYDGLGVSLTDSPQLIPVNLVHLDGSPALTGHYMVNLLPVHDDSNPSEHFVSSGRQPIPLTGYQEVEFGDVLGTASSPLLRVPSEAVTLHDVPADVSALSESPTTPASQTALPHSTTPDPPDEPPPRTPTPTRSQPTRIISSPLEHCSPPYSSDRFCAGRGLLGPHCPRRSLHNPYHLRGRLLVVQIGLRRMFPTSVRNQGTPRDSADSIAPLQTKPSPLETGRCHLGLLSRNRPHPALHVSVVEPPRVRPEEIGWHPNPSQLPKPEQGPRDSSDCDPPRRRGA